MATGMLVGYVANGATGVRYTAIRGEGAWVDGSRLQPSATRALDRSVIAITGLPPRRIGWRQFRALGSSALSLCDVAAGNVDGFLDCLPDQHAPWDYLGGLLVCREAGALVVDAHGRDLVDRRGGRSSPARRRGHAGAPRRAARGDRSPVTAGS